MGVISFIFVGVCCMRECVKKLKEIRGLCNGPNYDRIRNYFFQNNYQIKIHYLDKPNADIFQFT